MDQLFGLSEVLFGIFALSILAQGRHTRNIHEDSIFLSSWNQSIILTRISQISQKARRFARACRLCRVFSAGWYTQAIACVICEIREIRVKFNHLCVKILVCLPWFLQIDHY